MFKRILLLLTLCALLLPACVKYSDTAMDTPNPNAMDFKYDTGKRTVRFVTTMLVQMGGAPVGPEREAAAFDISYEAKRKGERIDWHVTMSDLAVMGKNTSDDAFYSVTFNSDLKGHDRQNWTELETPAKDTLGLSKAILVSISLPDGIFRIGDPSLPLFNEPPSSETLTVTLPEPDPKYIYEGVKEIDGQSYYSFYQKVEGVAFDMAGQKFTGSIMCSALSTSSMLPFRETAIFDMHNAASGLSIRYTATVQ